MEFTQKEDKSKKKGTDNASGGEARGSINVEDGKKEETKITEDKNEKTQKNEVEIRSSEHANINDLGGEEIVTTDNVIHDIKVQDELIRK